LSQSSQKYGVWGPGSGKNLFLIQGQKDTGSWIRIRKTALVCFFSYFLLFISQANGLSVRNELLSFHSKWYSSNIMSMAILGQQVGQILL
jgi:hypothetical protein